MPSLLRNTDCNPDYIDSCECGFFSIYIDEKKNVKPCSFSNDDCFTYNLKDYSFAEIWNEKLKGYRKKLLEEHACTMECKSHSVCRGNCLYFKELSLCRE